MKLNIATLAAAIVIAAGLLASPSMSAAAGGAKVVAQMPVAASALSGRVVDATQNTPLAGVKVSAFAQGSTMAESSAVTDDHGKFTLSGLHGGNYELLFERAGYPKSIASGITVRPNEHLVLISSFALDSNPRFGQVRLTNPCSSLLQPGEVADVYTICSGH
jgi:5-hydroxyisourate hydrolase-like protein (transthyretin family)